MKSLEYILSQPLLCTEDAVRAAIAIATREGGAGPELVEAKRGRMFEGAEAGMQKRGNVAVIPVVGPIFRYASLFTELCGGVTVEQLALDFQAAIESPGVEAIVLAIDSPGGQANGIDELAGMIRAGSEKKPVVAYVGCQAGSGAYWLASAAGEIVMSPAATVGSIGAVLATQVAADRPGTKTYEFVSSQSPMKRPNLETEAGRSSIQARVDDLATVFIRGVAEGRDTTPERVMSDFGGGAMLIAEKAIAVGMADRIGSFEEVIAELGEQAAAGQRTLFSTAAASQGGVAMFGFRLKPGKDGAVDIHALDSDGEKAIRVESAVDLKPIADAAAKDKEVAELRAKLAASELKTIEATAAGWYNTLFAADKIVPAEKDAALGAYVRAALDDTEHPLPDGKTRVALVEGIYSARTAHTLTQGLVDSDKEAPVLTSGAFKTLPRDKAEDHDAEVKKGLESLVAMGLYPANILNA